jgi:hypothetical protein
VHIYLANPFMFFAPSILLQNARRIMLKRFALLLSLVVCSLTSEAQAPPKAPAPTVPKNLEEFSAYSALWRTDQNFRSTVHLSNQLSVAEIDAVLTIYMADGTSWDLPTVHLAKSAVTTVDLNAAIASAPKKVQSHLSSYGSARLRYQYAWQGAILANISILDEVRSLEYMSPFTFPPNQGKGETIPAKLREFRDSANGTTYEGLWFREGHNGGGFIGLANTTDNQLSVHVAMSGQRSNTARDVTLQGHATALIDLRDVFGLNDQRVGGVTVSHIGPSGALQVVGGLEDLTTGFSTNMPLFPVATRAREIGDRRLGSAGMMVNEQNPHLGFPPGLRFYPYAFFRNIASEVRTLHFSAWYQEGNTAQHLSLPDLVIQPGQARELDIHDVLNNYPGVSDLNLLYEFTGDYTDIIAATGSTDGTGNYVFPILPEAIAPSGAKNSAYWDAQNGFDTMYTIWNPTDSPEDLIVLVRYGAGAKYTLPIHLEEYASTMVDIGELIRTQQPDQDGNILSHDAQQGSLLVSPATDDPMDQMTAVISVGIYNPRKGTCGMGCTSCSGLTQTRITPNSFILSTGTTAAGNYTYWMCDGSAYLISSRANWSSSNPPIASVQTAGQANPGLVTGVSPGSTSINAYFGPAPACIPQYCSPPPQNCPQYVYGNSGGTTVSTCQTPTGETTQYARQAVIAPASPTASDFIQTLQVASGASDNGASVSESEGQIGSDSCWWSGSPYPQLTSVTGGTWTVGGITPGVAESQAVPPGSGQWGPDIVGFFPGPVKWYQQNNPAAGKPLPCGVTAYQSLSLTCPSSQPVIYVYNSPLSTTIDSTGITNCRAGVCAPHYSYY